MARLIGQSRPHLETLDKLSRVAGTDAEVLISGPTGVGKELYALYVHERSKRASFPFVPVNCGAIPLELLENELFGHRSGAYTSAGASQEGLVAEAENGTLFLDEVDTLSLPSQVKLLRFIQLKEYRSLGIRAYAQPTFALLPQPMRIFRHWLKKSAFEAICTIASASFLLRYFL